MHTVIFLVCPFTLTLKVWRFGYQRRFVLLCAWLTLLPTTGLLPHISHILDIVFFPFINTYLRTTNFLSAYFELFICSEPKCQNFYFIIWSLGLIWHVSFEIYHFYFNILMMLDALKVHENFAYSYPFTLTPFNRFSHF